MEAVLIKYDWQENGLCKKEKKFIPETGEHVPYTVDDFYYLQGKVASEAVKDMCNRCPMKDKCLEHALAYEKYGYWGATSEQQREKMRSRKSVTLRHSRLIA